MTDMFHMTKKLTRWIFTPDSSAARQLPPTA